MEQNTFKIIHFTEAELNEIIKKAINEAILLIDSTKTSYQDEEYLNSKEACSFLNIKKTKLFSLKKNGEIPFHKEGGKLLFSKSSLKGYRQSIERSIKQWS
jgi:excisionase family DNA binding protein